MIMTTKIAMPNELSSTKEQSQKSYDYRNNNLKIVMNIKATISKNLSEEICLIMGGS